MILPATRLSLDSAAYHAHAAMSQSRLKEFASDPALFYEVRITHTRPPKPPTAEQIFGKVYEEFLLLGNPPDMPDVIRIPEAVLQKSKRGNTVVYSRTGKAWDEYLSENAANRDKLLLPREYDELIEEMKDIAKQLRAMAAVIASHRVAKALVDEGEPFVAIAWTDEDTGIEMRCQLDLLHPDCIPDLKTTANSRPRAFSADIDRFGYDVQGAVYQEAVRRLTGETRPVILIAQEKEPSYIVRTFRLSDDHIDLGRRKYRKILHAYAACLHSGVWREETHGRLIELDSTRWAEKNFNDWEY